MIEVKTAKEITVAYIEGKGLNNFDKEEAELKSIIEKNDIKTTESVIGIFYDNPADVGPENVKWDVCIPVMKNSKINNIKTKTLKSAKFASIIHKGTFDTLDKSFDEILSWISSHNHEIVGPIREIYKNKTTTEIQIPIK